MLIANSGETRLGSLRPQRISGRVVSVAAQKCVLGALEGGPRSVAELAQCSQLSARTVRGALAALELAGIVQVVAGRLAA